MEVTRLLECTGFHKHPHFASLSFNVRALPPRELPCYVLKMFSDLGLQKKLDTSKSYHPALLNNCKNKMFKI